MNTEGYRAGPADYSPADRWIRSRLNRVVQAIHGHFAAYRLDLAAQTLYDFTWREFCDWYLELSKPVLQSGTSSAAQKQAARETLIETLEALLRLLHPLIPFVTEEIWTSVAPRAGIDGDTIMLQPFPAARPDRDDSSAEEELDWVMRFILGIRQIRGEMDISPGKPLPILLQQAGKTDRERVKTHTPLLERLGRIQSIAFLEDQAKAPAAATALLGDMKLLVPMEGTIDIDAERERLGRQRQKIAADLNRSRTRLQNDNFVNNAPGDVVRMETERVAAFERQMAQLDEQLARLQRLG
jgi:valyl-tRNA synthetase